MSSLPGISDPHFGSRDRDAEKIDLLKKIAGLLSALVALALISVILQVVGLVRGENQANETQERLDQIRDSRVVVPTP